MGVALFQSCVSMRPRNVDCIYVCLYDISVQALGKGEKKGWSRKMFFIESYHENRVLEFHEVKANSVWRVRVW